MTAAAVNVDWTREQVGAVLEAVLGLDASRTAGVKAAVKELERAERRFAAGTADGRACLYFGVGPLSLFSTVLAESSSPLCASALKSLQTGAVSTQKAAKKAAAQRKPGPYNPLAEARDKKVRHITGRPRRER